MTTNKFKIKTQLRCNQYTFDTHCSIGLALLFIVTLKSWCFFMNDMVHHQYLYSISMNILTISIMIFPVDSSVYLDSIDIKFVYVAMLECIEGQHQCDKTTVVFSSWKQKQKNKTQSNQTTVNFCTTRPNFTYKIAIIFHTK